MSTYLDHPLQLPAYQSDVPLDLLMNVGVSKQNEYNTNYKAVQGQIDKLGQYPILKDSDREAISTKMNDLVDNLNQFSGKDLGDTQVYNQLAGLTNNFYNDKDVYEKIADNTRAATAMSDYQKMVKDDPSTYGATNSHIFSKAYSDWLNTPGKSFNASYTPYYDSSDEIRKTIAEVKKDPDIMLRTKTMPDGSKVPMGDQEVKMVTTQKIQAALKGSLSSQALNQYNIDYQASMDGHTAQSTAADIDKQINNLSDIRDQYNTAKGSASNSDEWNKQYLAAQDAQSVIDQLQAKKDAVIQNNDPSLYYSYDDFLGRKIKGVGDAYAYTQEGKVDWNPFALEDYKFGHEKELEKFKNDLKLYNSENGFTGKKDARIPGGSTLPVVNNFEETMKNVAINGGSHATTSEIMPLLGANGNANTDGSFSMPFQNENVAIDIQPMLAASGNNPDINKALALSPIRQMYKKWVTTPEGQKESVVNTGTGMVWDKDERRMVMHTESKPDPDQPKDFNTFLKEYPGTKAGQVFASSLKDKFGLDITSAKDMDVATKIAGDPATDKMMDLIGTALQKNSLNGNLTVIPAQGNNVIRSSDGQVYTKVYVQAPLQRYLAAFNESSFRNSTVGGAMDNLMDKGLITHTVNTDKDGKDMYQMTMYVKSNTDLVQANNNYVRDELVTKGKLTDQTPMYQGHFSSTMGDLGSIRSYSSSDGKQKILVGNGDQATDDAYVNATNIAKHDPAWSPYLTSIQNMLQTYKAALQDPGVSTDQKYDMYRQIKILNEAKTSSDIKALFQQPATKNVITLPEIQSQYFNKTFTKEYLMQNMDRVMSSVKSGEGTTNSVNPQTGAMGSYQFTPKTLQTIWRQGYNGKYPDFEDFRTDFLKSQTLQDNVMRGWMMSLGSQVGYNPYKIALKHFLGPNKDLDKIDWDANPTANVLDKNGKPIQNSTPGDYVQHFASAYGGI